MVCGYVCRLVYSILGRSKIEVVNESEERFFSTTAIIYYVISITNFTMIVMEWNM